MKLLIVDDSKSARIALRRHLELAGLEVLEAGSGTEALQLLKSESSAFDLIITDQNMPGMSGVELTTSLRGDSSIASHKSPVFFLTSDSSIAVKEECKALNVKALILKPVKPEALADAIKKFFRIS